MNKFKIPVIAFVVLLVIILVIVNNLNNKNGKLVSPSLGKTASQIVPSPQAPTNNPPIEIKYDSATDLKKELESIDPQVLDSDF